MMMDLDSIIDAAAEQARSEVEEVVRSRLEKLQKPAQRYNSAVRHANLIRRWQRECGYVPSAGECQKLIDLLLGPDDGQET